MSREDRFAVALEELVAYLSSKPAEAATAAAALLELNAFPAFSSIDEFYYERLLPAALMERELREDEERLLVDEPHRLVVASPNEGSPKSGHIYALGRSNAWIAIPKVLDLLVNHRAALIVGDIHQCVHSLQNCLDLPEDHSQYPEIVSAVTQLEPTPALVAIARTPLEPDPETGMPAHRRGVRPRSG